MPLDHKYAGLIPRPALRATLSALAAMVLLSACAGSATSISKGNTPQQQRAMAMWQERCKKSGEFIYKTVEGVEGIYLVNVRMRTNMGESERDQFELDDPYGHDSTKDNYILSFLQGNHYRVHGRPQGFPLRIGYLYVETVDHENSRLTRYVGRVEEPWQRDKSYLKGYTRFVLDRTPVEKRTALYGVKFEDISTREEREHWIAGSSLKVIDLQTQEVIAERIGYMVDWAQGNRAAGRSPWLLAANYACPAFDRNFTGPFAGPGSSLQEAQTLDFAEKVLKPIQR